MLKLLIPFVKYDTFFYKKPSSRPSTKSFLIFGQILVVKIFIKVSYSSELNCCRTRTQNVNVANRLPYSKQNASVRVRF